MSDHEIEDEIIELEDENGNIREMLIAETFEFNEKIYAVLVDRNNLEGEAVIVIYEEVGEELILTDIEDDAEWEQVLKAYESLSDSDEDN